MSRAYNFAAGPAAVPEPVLRRAQAELLEWGSARDTLDVRDEKVLKVACRIPKFVPSVKECEQIWAIRSRLVKEGFQDAEE